MRTTLPIFLVIFFIFLAACNGIDQSSIGNYRSDDDDTTDDIPPYPGSDDDDTTDDTVADDDDTTPPTGDDDDSAAGDDDDTSNSSPDADSDGYTVADGDCDDTDVNIHPGVFEACDGLDTNCSNAPSFDPPTAEVDGDGDGMATCAGDCDDSNPNVFLDAPELCDGLDSDCDGIVPSDETTDFDGDGIVDCEDTDVEITDDDGDGAAADIDCDDADPTIYPGASELCNGIDDNCDGAADEGLSPDIDGDGFTDVGSCLGSANDCDDSDAAINPSAIDTCGDGLDQNCDGLDSCIPVDQDADGYDSGDDCDDNDAAIYPSAPELCDGIDSACDGLGDEDDVDADGSLGCDDCNDADPNIFPGAPEVCGDGVDQDCDTVDEVASCDPDGDGIPSGSDIIELAGSTLTINASGLTPTGTTISVFMSDPTGLNSACLMGEGNPFSWITAQYCVAPTNGSWNFNFAAMGIPTGTYRITIVQSGATLSWGMYGSWALSWDLASAPGDSAAFDNDGTGPSTVYSIQVGYDAATNVVTGAGN